MKNENDQDSPLPQRNRTQVARDMFVFQAKLFVDGIKDIMLSPLAFIAALAGIFLGRDPGVPLYKLLRFGKRAETWIDLFSAGYATNSEKNSPPKNGDETPTKSESTRIDFDSLIGTLESSLTDPKARARVSEKSREQIDAIARFLRREDPKTNHKANNQKSDSNKPG